MKKLLILGLVLTLAAIAGCRAVGGRQAQVTLTVAPTATPVPATPIPVPSTAMSTIAATSTPTTTPVAMATPVPTVTTSASAASAPQTVAFPATVWRNSQPVHDSHYDVVYDPAQSGAFDLPAKGWWWQPQLPGPHREYHEVAIILQAGTYRFIGPECTVYFNFDGNHGLKAGTVLVDRQNVENLVVPKTQGAPGNESWVFVACQASDAGGFSFALK